MPCDQMTSGERWEALARGEPLDRVPCLQFMLGHTAPPVNVFQLIKAAREYGRY